MSQIIEVEKSEATAVATVAVADSGLATLKEQMEALVIEDQDGVDNMTAMVREVKGIFKDSETDRKGIVDPINASLKKINDKYRPLKAASEMIERLGKGKIMTYHQKVEAERREEERKIREKEDKERRRKEELARKAQERGDFEKAQEHAQKAAEVPVAVIEPEATVSTGSHTVTTWHAEVTSFEDLILAVADTIVAKRSGETLSVMLPVEALEANQKYLNGVAKGVKDTVKWPGVRFFSKTDLTVRR